jgi:dimethylhistidine N-methyltransferase
MGSALFEAICLLPWYHIARTEQRLLSAHSEGILARLAPVSAVVELGPGSGEKLLTLLAAAGGRRITVHLIDVSDEALEQATRTLAVAPEIAVVPHRATYAAGLSAIQRPQASDGRVLVVLLGSNIGNFDPAGADALLRSIRDGLRGGDALLLGTDLVKAETAMQLAYDDPLGVTAAFNRNLLVRVNRELGGDFDVSQFAHRASWNAGASRMEMHLVSGRRQRVRVPACGLDIMFETGEAIWTESSYKYRIEDLTPMLARSGFSVAGQWEQDGFALTLAEAH